MTFSGRRSFVYCPFFMVFVAIGFSSVADATFLPPNKLHLSPASLALSNISERQFNTIISQIEKIYAPVISAHGARLKVNRRWKEVTVNASASQEGKIWLLDMYGGLARRPEVTPDGFAMVVCHELGHHLGGYTFYQGGINWASNEGEADYFATQSCAREIWRSDVAENARHRATVNPVAKLSCEMNFAKQEERDLCFRTANAGLSLASLLAALGESQPPKYETPDTTVVEATQDPHPKAQCRLDTYLAGSVCSVAFKKSLIPAKDLADRFGLDAEVEAGKVSCMASDGWVSAQRPRCWFKPQIEFEGLVAQVETWSDASGNGQAEPGERVRLSIPIANRWSRKSEVVTGELFSRTAGISVVKSKTNYPDVASQSIEQPLEPFEIEVSKDFPCGYPFELLFRAGSKNGSREFPINWFVGPKQSGAVVIGGQSTAINIEDAPAPAVEIPMESPSAVVVDELELAVQVVGTYPEEIEFTVVTPAGRVVPVSTGDVFDAYGNAKVKIALGEPTALRGRWKLTARDKQENDLATIAHFELRAPLAEKVTCSSATTAGRF